MAWLEAKNPLVLQSSLYSALASPQKSETTENDLQISEL